MGHTRQRSLLSVVSLVLGTTVMATVILAGCGGGGGSSNDAATSSVAQGTISGNAVKGPVSGGTVSAYGVSNGAAGPALASATTDAHGGFMLSIGAYSGPVMLRMSGGTYTDEATGSAMSMAAGDVMTAALADVPAGSAVSGVQMTPLTSMAQAMAVHMAGGMTRANISTANAAVGAYFMVDDILYTPPMNPLMAGSGSAVAQAMMNYGVTLAAMSQYAKNVGMPVSSSLVTDMMADASDGKMDGAVSGTQIMMGGMMGGAMMQANAGTSGLASAMSDFLGSSVNQSGVTLTKMSALMQKLANSDGMMH